MFGIIRFQPAFIKLVLLTIISLFATQSTVFAGVLEDTFNKSDEKSTVEVDHSKWDELLKVYVVSGDDGLNRVNYKLFKEKGKSALAGYLEELQKVDVPKLNRKEQFAFWSNLYNAKTVDIIIEHYPVKSIRDIDISGFFANGPWGKKVVKVNGVDLSLDDIEHKILRGFWKEPRVHYAVNCASIGCPNLAQDAFTGKNLEELLEKGAKAYVNSPRGAKFEKNRLIVSKIYSWFNKDFGRTEANIIKHLRVYAVGDLKTQLNGTNDIYDYEYDWSLNDTNKTNSN